MFILFKDNSHTADWGLELGYSNIKYIEIIDSLIDTLSPNFIRVFKQTMKQKKYSSFKIRKTKPKNLKELQLHNFVDMNFDTSKIYIKYEHQHNLLKAYENDVEIVSKYYENRADTTSL